MWQGKAQLKWLGSNFAGVCSQRLCSQLAGVSLAASQRWAPPK